jgi:hypothetical protein
MVTSKDDSGDVVMDNTRTVNATEFKAKWLDMLDRVGTGEREI